MKPSQSLPLVSICIPTYNGAKYLAETLNCAINQTYPNIEIIITDDQSTDNTLEICNNFAKKDPRIKMFQNKKNLGLVGNWCEVINKTSKNSEWIKYLFQDDLMAPETVGKMLNSALENKVGFVLCDREYIFEKNVSQKTIKSYGLVKKTGDIFVDSRKYSPRETSQLITPYIFNNCIGEPPCTLFNKNNFSTNDFHSDLPQMVDYIFGLSKILESDFYYINEPLVQFRVHNNSQTGKNNTQKEDTPEDIIKYIHIHTYEKLKLCYLILNDSKFVHIKNSIGRKSLVSIMNYLFYSSYYKNKKFKNRITVFYRSSKINTFLFKEMSDSFIYIRYKFAKFQIKNFRKKYNI